MKQFSILNANGDTIFGFENITLDHSALVLSVVPSVPFQKIEVGQTVMAHAKYLNETVYVKRTA